MAYENFKDWVKRTASDKILRERPFNITKNPKYDLYQRVLASMFYKFFDKISAGIGVITYANNEHPLGLAMQKLAEELHKL